MDKHTEVLPHHRVLALQEQLMGFIVEHVINPDGEFHERPPLPAFNTDELGTTSTSSKSDKKSTARKQ